MFDVEDRRLMEEKGRVDERKRMEDRVNYVVKEWEGKMDKVVREGDMKENENRRLKEQVETL